MLVIKDEKVVRLKFLETTCRLLLRAGDTANVVANIRLVRLIDRHIRTARLSTIVVKSFPIAGSNTL